MITKKQLSNLKPIKKGQLSKEESKEIGKKVAKNQQKKEDKLKK